MNYEEIYKPIFEIMSNLDYRPNIASRLEYLIETLINKFIHYNLVEKSKTKKIAIGILMNIILNLVH